MFRVSGRYKKHQATICEKYVKLKHHLLKEVEQEAKPQALTSWGLALYLVPCGALAAEAQTRSFSAGNLGHNTGLSLLPVKP